ncbi:hypothetical protein [Psychrobacter sanguinis]|uniref:hypothetical protein n=1 Tax=Psychrobacter sanguinis TaxID=861445 RepID=UPI001919A045|nr:hypothetical protein [Psychrobacter sanguinis]UEC26066.1 hypothetical protein LK453_02700 [Psychrobacter sanguinis]
MSELSWLSSYGFIGIRLFDLPNLLICLLLALILSYKFRVPLKFQLILALHCFLPFVLNGLLFAPSYMPDQIKYWRIVHAIRNNELTIYEALIGTNNNVSEAGAFLSVLPFPSPTTVISLGFYNTFIYICLFFILYKNKVFTKVSIWFYLLFPSAALYSALSLRETLIFLFMSLSIMYARKSNFFISMFFLIPLYMIKFQNFFILFPIVLLYFLFGVAKKGMRIVKASMIALIALVGLLISFPIAIPEINKFRVAMFIEDGGARDNINLINGVGDFIIQGLTSGIYFLSKPFIWEAQGLLPLIQSFENVIILFILYLITRQAWKKSLDKLAFWLLFLAFSMSIYGLVVFNYGTAVRYRYPFVMIYVLFVCADCNIQQLLPKRKNTTS